MTEKDQGLGQGRQERSEEGTSVSTVLAGLSLPVALKPYGASGKAETEYIGEPEITIRRLESADGGYEIVITQSIAVKIPLRYGAELEPGDFRVRYIRTGE